MKRTQLKKKEDWITALTSVVVNEVKQGNEKTVVLTLRENIHSAVEEARKEMKKEIKGMKEGKIDIVKLKAEGVVNLQSWAEGYDQALEDVLDLISHKKTK